MMYRTLGIAVAILLVYTFSLADVTIIDDDFDGNDLSPDWDVCLNITSPSTGWEYTVAAGTLAVTSVGPYNSNVWSSVRLRRACRAPEGFRVDCWLGWDAVSSGAMQQLRVVLLDSTGSHVASVGYSDAWFLFSGVESGSAGGESFAGITYLPFAGMASAAIERIDSTVRIYWDSSERLVAAESARVDSLELSFWYYSYPGAYFGTEFVDRVTVTVPETAVEATTWTRVKALYRH